MGHTITEKIIASHAGVDEVTPGDFVEARVDFIAATYNPGSLVISKLKEMGCEKVFDKSKVALVMGNPGPAPSIEAATLAKICRDFAKEQDLDYLFEVQEGTQHGLLPEKGLVAPGEFIVGVESHGVMYGALGAFSVGISITDAAYIFATGYMWLRVPPTIKIEVRDQLNRFVTSRDIGHHVLKLRGEDVALYKAVEFTGEAIHSLTIDERQALCAIMAEGAAKNVVMPPDDVTERYVSGRVTRPYTNYDSDTDADYEETIVINGREVEPTVAAPYSPANIISAREAGGVRIDQVVIGCCCNGRLEDFRQAAEMLRGRKVAKGVRLLMIPSSRQIYLDALREGLLEACVEAGAAITPPTCGPCAGEHMGVLAAGEVCVSTTDRNFVGRMGHVDSKTYLAGPYVAAASAVAGTVIDPNDL